MSASILGNITDPDSEHVAIIRHIRFNETLHGGWDEWSVACICGGLYEPRFKNYYIPSRVQAERIFNQHAGIQTSQEGESSEGRLDASTVETLSYYREDRTVYV